MKKIVAFYGSPRKNGFSAQLVNKVLEGVRDAGAEVVTYDLCGKNVKGCQGCFYCREHSMDCAVRDDLHPMYKDIQEADAIVAGFPIYFYTISAQGKVLIDRLYPLMGSDYKPRCPGKKMVAVYAQGYYDPQYFAKEIEANNGIFRYFGWDVTKTLLAYNTHKLDMKAEEAMLLEAYETGKNLI